MILKSDSTTDNSAQVSQPKKKRLVGLVGFIFGFVLIIVAIGSALSFHRTPTNQQEILLKSPTSTTVVFYSRTCPDCKKLEPYFRYVQAQDKFSGTSDRNIVYLSYANKHDRRLFKQYGVHYVPTIMIFKNGQPQLLSNDSKYQYSGTDHSAVKYLYQHSTLVGYQK